MQENIIKIFTVYSPEELEFLSQEAFQVDIPINEATEKTIRKMIEILKERHGAGLAAPQIGINYKIMLCSFNRDINNIEVMINPSLQVLSSHKEYNWEGCFSVPLVFVKVARWRHIQVGYYNEKGNKINRILKDNSARIFQHEFDHLKGKLIIKKGVDKKVFSNQKDYKEFFYTKVLK